jgi:hypothetical protein
VLTRRAGTGHSSTVHRHFRRRGTPPQANVAAASFYAQSPSSVAVTQSTSMRCPSWGGHGDEDCAGRPRSDDASGEVLKRYVGMRLCTKLIEGCA